MRIRRNSFIVSRTKDTDKGKRLGSYNAVKSPGQDKNGMLRREKAPNETTRPYETIKIQRVDGSISDIDIVGPLIGLQQTAGILRLRKKRQAARALLFFLAARAYSMKLLPVLWSMEMPIISACGSEPLPPLRLVSGSEPEYLAARAKRPGGAPPLHCGSAAEENDAAEIGGIFLRDDGILIHHRKQTQGIAG